MEASLLDRDQASAGATTSTGRRRCLRSGSCGRARRQAGQGRPMPRDNEARPRSSASRPPHSSASGSRAALMGPRVRDPRHVPPRCPGQPPAAPGPPSWTPTYEAAAVAPAGRRHRAWREARMHKLFKPRFKLNADAPAPGTSVRGRRLRLACAWRTTGGRASACKTLASQQARAPKSFRQRRQPLSTAVLSILRPLCAWAASFPTRRRP